MPSTVSSCPSGLDCLPILDLLPESWFQSQKPRPFFCEPLLKKLEPGASKVPSGRSVPISLALCTQSLNPLDRGQHRQDARAPFRPLAISRGLPPSLSLSLSGARFIFFPSPVHTLLGAGHLSTVGYFFHSWSQRLVLVADRSSKLSLSSSLIFRTLGVILIS